MSSCCKLCGDLLLSLTLDLWTRLGAHSASFFARASSISTCPRQKVHDSKRREAAVETKVLQQTLKHALQTLVVTANICAHVTHKLSRHSAEKVQAARAESGRATRGCSTQEEVHEVWDKRLDRTNELVHKAGLAGRFNLGEDRAWNALGPKLLSQLIHK